jgi:hypothetical protein
MAQDWIKMKRGMRADPKVIAMARSLIDTPGFLESCVTDARHVTECVTFAVVTRVTVAGLLDVWSALNHSLKSDGRAAYMTLGDVDAMAEIPGFGEAMRKVGWVSVLASGGLVFPNFAENNAPAKERSGAMTAAERQAARRARLKAEKEAEKAAPEPVTMSRHVTLEEKRRDIKRESAGATPLENDLATQAETIVAAYPRREKTAAALLIVLEHLTDGADFEAMLSGTKAAAAILRTLPSAHLNRYTPSAESFFKAKRWADDPETLRRQGDTKSGSAPTSSDEFMDQLGGRAGNLQPTA